MDEVDGPSSHPPQWKAVASAHLKWKVFVPATKSDAPSQPQASEAEGDAANESSSQEGEEASQFYESITEEGDSGRSDVRGRGDVRGTDTVVNLETEEESTVWASHSVDVRTLHQALRLAQEDNAAGLEVLLDAGLSVDAKDEHGWSLLMVAACAGASHAVQTLLARQALTGVRDARGNTALYLAATRGHKGVVELLIKSRKRREIAKDTERLTTALHCTPTGETAEDFYCDICKATIKESSRKRHKTSIVHQFNEGGGGSKTIYGIPPSNKGYQLLVGQGWDVERGLGPESEGRKYPIKTVLKQNREGLGGNEGERAAPRVTHFGPGDTSAVGRAERHPSGLRVERAATVSKREAKMKKMADQMKERRIRRMLNEPDY